MGDVVRIPIDDGGWIEVPADDPRAVGYLRHYGRLAPPPPKPAAVPRRRSPRSAPRGIYTVQPGDTLSAIAQDLLGDAKLYGKLAELNQLSNPNMILVGQHLVVPDRTSAAGGGNDGTGGGSTGPQASPGNQGLPPAMATAASDGSGANLALARGFMFVIFEQLPNVGVSARIIRKVAIVPRNYAFPVPSLGPNFGIRMPGVGPLLPRSPSGTISAVDHVMNTAPARSPFLSASDRAFGSGSIEGTPLLIDVAKIRTAGGQVMSVDEVVAELLAFVTKNPASRPQMEKLMWTISKIEGEVLIRGGVPRGAAVPITGSAHLGHIRSAEGLWSDFKAGDITKLELQQGLVDLERSYSRARVVGRVGRVFTVVGVVLTAYDLEQATERSYQQHSAKPIGAEVIRQVGGWGGAVVGAKIGAATGALFGIETGPGAIVTGAIGAIVFGAAGYFGFDMIADQISPN